MDYKKNWMTLKKLVKIEIKKDNGELRGTGRGCAYVLGMIKEGEELGKYKKNWMTLKKLVKIEIKKDNGELWGIGPGCAYVLGIIDEAEELGGVKSGKRRT